LRLHEEQYSIEADIIKGVLQFSQLDDFFNECKDKSVTAYKYNIVEYHPDTFKLIRAREQVTEEMLMQ
jgi:hypothetical protein